MPPASERPPHLRELGEFFRTRRSELDPATIGIDAASSRRRVSGLRREEIAEIASISTDYYTRIEQGRLAPSAGVFDSLARALRLDDDQTDYAARLIENAAHEEAAPLRATTPRTKRTDESRVRPQLQRLLDQLTDTPAIVLGPRTQLLAWNPLAEKVYVEFSRIPARERNYVRLIFTDPRMRKLFEDWTSVAKSCVAVLRREAVANPGDPALSALVGELTIVDRQFGQWWAARNVTRQDFGTKVLRNGIVGDLTLDWDIFRHAGAPDQQLILNSAEPGSETQDRLRRLRDLET